MLSTSERFRRSIAQNTKVLAKAELTLADGTSVEISGDDLMMGAASFSEAVSTSGSFDIGAAIINTCSLTLNNIDGRFGSYDFTGAEVVPYIGVEFGDGSVEWLRKGRFGVEQPDSYGNTIELECYDNMRKLERPYSGVGTAYPATLGHIVGDICEHCGVTLLNQSFPNSSYVVDSAPGDGNLTCLGVLSYAAQASGNFAKCDNLGRVDVRWYDTSLAEGEAWIDGGRLSGTAAPYDTGDSAEGGSFESYDGGDAIDGGDFSPRSYAAITAWSSATIVTDDVVVTGVRVVADDDGEGEQGETALHGSEGYVLEISDNPLVQHGRASAVAALVGPRVVGMRFRPFECRALGDPSVEAGDPVMFTDSAQNRYLSYLTSVAYRTGGYETYRCSAETPSRNSAAVGASKTLADVKARNAVKAEKEARERAVADLAKQLSESSGLYASDEVQPDGSRIYYMHDKPTLAESKVVWKMTAEVIGVSTDGGSTYPYGLNVDGDAILNKIYAIGINADYLTTGCINSKADNGTSWDLAAGTFRNTVKQVDYKTDQGYSKALSTDDAVWESESQWGTSIAEENVVTYEGDDVVVKYPRYVMDGELASTVEFYANKAMSIGTMTVGFLEENDTLFGTFADQESMRVSGGISGAANSIRRHAAATAVAFPSPQSVTKGQLLCRLSFSWLKAPGTLRCDAYFNTDAEGGALRPCNILGKMKWAYRVEQWKRASIRIEMSPKVLFGLYEAYQPFWRYYDRVSGNLVFTQYGEEVMERYIGGFSVYDGALRFVSHTVYLEGGARIANDGDGVRIGFPNMGGFNDLWFSKESRLGAAFGLHIMSDACLKGSNSKEQCSLSVNQDGFDIHCGSTGAGCYRTSNGAGLYFDGKNGIRVQSGHVYAIVNGTTKTLA